MPRESMSKEITAITTLKIGENGQPITVTSEIQHSDGVKYQTSQNGNKMELSFVPRAKNRKKRPSREFLQRTADESESTEDSEIFWHGSEAVVAEIAATNNNNVHIMTPIIEAPTPNPNRQKILTAMTPKPPAKCIALNSIPFARKYKRLHSFKAQVILNSELCAHCDKRTKFGKMVMKCKECELLVHTECKDLLQRPCYPAFNFPAQGKICDYVLNEAPCIPPILQMIVHEIEQRGILGHEVGLYRVNGSDTQIKQLRERILKRHQAPDFRKINDVHVLCSFVKDFLNNLSEHLITYESWHRFAEAAGN